MLFGATHTHPASKCPLEMPEGKAMVKKLFSEENVKKSGLKIIAADGPAAVTKFFGPMTVDVRSVVPLSEVAKTL